VAAPPLPGAGSETSAAGQAANFLASLVGMGPSSTSLPVTNARATTGAELRRGRQVIAEGDRIPDHFEERSEGAVRPAGKVVGFLPSLAFWPSVTCFSDGLGRHWGRPICI
jgi:hypothetical protein